MSRIPRRSLLAVGALVLAVGAVDSAIDAAWDSVVCFAVALICVVVLATEHLGQRRSVTLRTDLARWLADRAAAGAEPVTDTTDRAVAAFRAGLVGDDDA